MRTTSPRTPTRAAVQRARDEDEREPRRPGPLADDATRDLADKTIRNIMGPLRKCLDTARREGLIRHNPATDIELPHRPQLEVDDGEDGSDVRALTRVQLDAFLGIVHPRHRLFFEVIAATGLRVSEAIARRWCHVRLDGSRPHVRVRQRIRHGKDGPVKSKYSRRDVPLPQRVVERLRERRRDAADPICGRPPCLAGDGDLVFPSKKLQKPIGTSNLRRRVLKPAVEESDAAWAGFHAFRHTFASMHIGRGTNIVQLSRLLGHHSAGFTLSVYGHLMDEGVGAPLDLAVALAKGGNGVATDPTGTGRNGPQVLEPDLAA